MASIRASLLYMTVICVEADKGNYSWLSPMSKCTRETDFHGYPKTGSVDTKAVYTCNVYAILEHEMRPVFEVVESTEAPGGERRKY